MGALLCRRAAHFGGSALSFPRREYPAVSTAFAILFWLSIAATIVCTALTVGNRGKPARGKPARQNKNI